MSFNIRNTDAPDGDNHWVHRRNLWIDVVRGFNPDLLGVQEVLADQYAELRDAFPDYQFVGMPRDDGVTRGERALILFRSDRFEKIAAGDFWLSDTPDIPGSKSWDSKHVRICSWARLKDRQAPRILLHANTHFDDQGKTARHEAAKLISRQIPALADNEAAILTGDFNSTELEQPYAALVHPAQRGAIPLSDSYRTLHPTRRGDESSFHGFTGNTQGHRIDWILHSSHLIPISAEILHQPAPDGRWPSDHFPVTTVFRSANNN